MFNDIIGGGAGYGLRGNRRSLENRSRLDPCRKLQRSPALPRDFRDIRTMSIFDRKSISYLVKLRRIFSNN